MIGDLIIAGFIGMTVGFVFGIPWGIAISQTSLEEIEEEREKDDRY